MARVTPRVITVARGSIGASYRVLTFTCDSCGAAVGTQLEDDERIDELNGAVCPICASVTEFLVVIDET